MDDSNGSSNSSQNLSRSSPERNVTSSMSLPITSDSSGSNRRSTGLSSRAILLGLVNGLLICFANTYFGLQAGFVNSMTMTSGLVGFGVFRMIKNMVKSPLSPAENAIVIAISGSFGTMPWTTGLLGIVPAFEFLTTFDEGGPFRFELWQLLVWAAGLSILGIVIAPSLRNYFLFRQQLRFPLGTSAAAMIGLLHKDERITHRVGLANTKAHNSLERAGRVNQNGVAQAYPPELDIQWRLNMKCIIIAFSFASIYACTTYFIPAVQRIPVFGTRLASEWAWALSASPAYVGMGMLVEPATSAWMAIGVVIGWGILSPLSRLKGWAPGPTTDWESGAQGWIIWVALGVILGDAVVHVTFIYGRILYELAKWIRKTVSQSLSSEGSGTPWTRHANGAENQRQPLSIHPNGQGHAGIRYLYSIFGIRHANRFDEQRQPLFIPLNGEGSARIGHRLYGIFGENQGRIDLSSGTEDNEALVRRSLQNDAAPHPSERPESPTDIAHVRGDQNAPNLDQKQIPRKTLIVWVLVSAFLSVGAMWVLFRSLISPLAVSLAVTLILPLSIVSIRALGQTGNAAADSAGRLTQFIFAVLIPRSTRGAVISNMAVASITEAGAWQSAELMDEMKMGWLVGSPQIDMFYGQLIGSFSGAITASLIYRLYTSVYSIPSDTLPVPIAHMWYSSAQLMYQTGLPRHVVSFAAVAFGLSALSSAVKITTSQRYGRFFPQPIALAIGMYIKPEFVLARDLGGAIRFCLLDLQKLQELPIISVASGLILGEGIFSIAKFGLHSAGVPHLSSTLVRNHTSVWTPVPVELLSSSSRWQ